MKEYPNTMFRMCCITDDGRETCGMWQEARDHLDEICEARNSEEAPCYLYVESFAEVVERSHAMMKDVIRRSGLNDDEWIHEIPDF